MNPTNSRKNNMKLYPIYEMFAYDLLFFYGIRVMFFSDVKHFTDSQIVLSAALFALFTVLLQFPVTLVVNRLGKKKGAIIGNLINVIWAISMFFITNFTDLILLQIPAAMAFAFKSVSAGNLLSDSIPESTNQRDIYVNIDKKGFSRYSFLSAVSTIIAGWLYGFNPYIPIILCLIFTIISTIISFSFTEIKEPKIDIAVKENVNNLKQGIHFIANSRRLRALQLLTGAIWGVTILLELYELELLQYIGASSFIVCLTFALMELTKGISSREAPWVNKMLKNKTLTSILIVFILGFILIGLMAMISFKLPTKIILITVILVLLNTVGGIARILSKKYFNNFTDNEILPSIYTAKSISDNVFRVIFTLLGSSILLFTNINKAFIVYGICLVPITLLANLYAKKRLGLNPDKYPDKDIYIK